MSWVESTQTLLTLAYLQEVLLKLMSNNNIWKIATLSSNILMITDIKINNISKDNKIKYLPMLLSSFRI